MQGGWPEGFGGVYVRGGGEPMKVEREIGVWMDLEELTGFTKNGM